MVSIYLQLALLWICTMLTYLLGDVLRIFKGDFKPGEIDGVKASGKMFFGIAVLMVIPIIMIVLSIFLPQNINKWVNIITASFFLLFNLVGFAGYKAYDKFLLIVSMVFNAMVVYLAFGWN